jgi:CBS domain containing-hemolysin-like protein
MSDSNGHTGAERPPSLLQRLSNLLRGSDSAAQMRESLEEVIEESERGSTALSAPERTLLANLLKFGELKILDVMVPRADIISVDEQAPLADLVALFHEAQHSRLPVYRETLDNPTGLVHVKDVLALIVPLSDGDYRLGDAAISKVLRPILFAPPSMRALDLLVKMQASHTHLALVIDEYGGTDGLVSIEDIIEEIVGDIADEHDEATPRIRSEGDGFVADARAELKDFKTETGHDLVLPQSEQDIDSVGGLVVSLLGRVPQRGEIVAHPAGYEFEVLEADPRRVKRVRIRPPASSAQPA